MKAKNIFSFKISALVILFFLAVLIVNPWPTKISWLDWNLSKLKYNLGLDLQGGVHLVYQADMSNIDKGKEPEALSAIQDVIERRVNAFGVAEPIIQTSVSGSQHRLIVQLAGVKDIEQAKNIIKETPYLEFKEQGEPAKLPQEGLDFINQQNQESFLNTEELLKKALSGEDFAELAKNNSQDPGSKDNGGDLDFFKKGVMVAEFDAVAFRDDFKVGTVYPQLVKSSFGYHILKKLDEKGEGENKEVRVAHILLKTMDVAQVEASMQPDFKTTGLSGKNLESAQLVFDQQLGTPQVSLYFDAEGTEMFKQITERNIKKQVAIYLDGQMISAPVVQDVIRNGEAVINGDFTIQEGKDLAQKLNAGALPVPIKLVSQESVDASLGKTSLVKSLKAGLYGLIAISIFMVVYYRLAGLVAVLALCSYVILMAALLKFSSLSQSFTITLTLAGIAGFILSVGMAVDANVLIFERMKEELKMGRGIKSAVDEGFRRAWPSIRDGNYSTILTCLILMFFGTGFIKGFAITLVLGILVSMFTALTVTRTILNLVLINWFQEHKAWIVGSVGNKKQ